MRDWRELLDADITWDGVWQDFDLGHLDVDQRLLLQEDLRRDHRRDLIRRVKDASTPLPSDEGLLDHQLRNPPEAIEWSMRNLLPAGGNIGVTAAFKTGKTVLLMNAAKAYADGQALLGYFKVRELVRRVSLWNLELGQQMALEWLGRMGIEHPERIALENLRGYPIDLMDDRWAEWAVDLLKGRDTEVWMIDTRTRLYKGDENSNTELGRWCLRLDEIKQAAGVSELWVSGHMGRKQHEQGQEHGRGATAFDDWVDVRAIYTRQDQQRFLFAQGRDVELDETAVDFEAATLDLTWRWGEKSSRQDVKHGQDVREIEAEVLRVVAEHPGIGSTELRAACEARKADYLEARRNLMKSDPPRLIVKKEGLKSGHYLA